MTQQSYENQLSFGQVEILNVTCEDGGELSLNILLKEILAADVVEDTAVIGDKISRILGS